MTLSTCLVHDFLKGVFNLLCDRHQIGSVECCHEMDWGHSGEVGVLPLLEHRDTTWKEDRHIEVEVKHFLCLVRIANFEDSNQVI